MCVIGYAINWVICELNIGYYGHLKNVLILWLLFGFVILLSSEPNNFLPNVKNKKIKNYKKISF